MLGQINSEQLLDHWIACQTPSDPRYEDFIEQGKRVAVQFKEWKMKDILVNEILNYQGSVLENSGPLVTKIDDFLRTLRNINDLPPIVLVPIDHKNKRPFIEYKYGDKSLKWEPADGVHRLHLILRLGLNTIKSYVPLLGRNTDDNS